VFGAAPRGVRFVGENRRGEVERDAAAANVAAEEAREEANGRHALRLGAARRRGARRGDLVGRLNLEQLVAVARLNGKRGDEPQHSRAIPGKRARMRDSCHRRSLEWVKIPVRAHGQNATLMRPMK
jgi:hypothetical protein